MPALSPYQSLAFALRERLKVIADRDLYQRDPQGHLASLQRVSEEIETLAAALPSPVDAQLAHYIQRRSYDKALAFLEAHSCPQSPEQERDHRDA